MRKMKDSGVEWLGKIPKDWALIRFKDKYKNTKEIAKEQASNYERLALTLGGVVKRPKDDSEGLQPKEFDGYQILRENDFVFKMIDLQNVSTSRVGLSPYTGLVSPAYIRFSPKEPCQYNRFVYYFLMSLYYNQVFNNLGGNGVRSALSAKDMGEFLMPYPSKNEQQKICALIDNKTERISWLIFNVQAQIEKLKAYKQSLITEVVTKGLDPTAPMKDSGVEWIGEIPVSWGIAKLQYCAKIRSGITLGKKYPDDSELIERPYLRVANVQNGGVVLDDLKTIEVSAEEDAQYRLSAGEVLMTEGGDRDKLGRGCVWLGQVEPCLHQNHIFALRTNKLLNPYFLSYVTASKIGRVYFDITAIKTTNLACTNSSKVLAFKLPLPSAGEQQQMVDYLDRQVDKIDKLISAKQSKIEKLEQYKRSLIYEYVTGKKEVS
ncbi:restriction endonuclease subunit S [Faecalibacterium prausnitzii]|uniref:restriction endonuclease subunit S n=1 Tax=Faecalibacterium prausnitzii TaxID=853 RepID=UPI0012DDA821|nr:restriction endonuclease subunit S [Faecalibacterium prausnitzii]